MTESLGINHFTGCTAEIVIAYVKNNAVNAPDLLSIIATVGDTLRAVTDGNPSPKKPMPAVLVRHSVKKDHIVCLVCGQKHKMIKRHLRTAHKLSPSAYRGLFDLKHEYPLIAPNYAEIRSRIATKISLGGKRGKHRT